MTERKKKTRTIVGTTQDGENIYKAKNGAKYILGDDGKAEFVDGAPKKYLDKIRVRAVKHVKNKKVKALTRTVWKMDSKAACEDILKYARKKLREFRKALVNKAKVKAKEGGRFYVNVPKLKQIMLQSGVPAEALRGQGFLDFIKGAWREITNIPKYFNVGMKTMFGNASNVVKNGMARALDVVAPGTGVVAQTLMGNGKRGRGVKLHTERGRGLTTRRRRLN
mgnify:CR=1 FL=1